MIKISKNFFYKIHFNNFNKKLNLYKQTLKDYDCSNCSNCSDCKKIFDCYKFYYGFIIGNFFGFSVFKLLEKNN